MWFINKRYADYKTIRISQSGMDPSTHYKLGQIIAEAAEKTGRKTVLIASSDLSHKLKDDGPYGYAPEGPIFDETVTQALARGDFLALLKISDDLREGAAECGYNSLTILAGCYDRQNVDAKLLSYEGPFGVGYAIASFTPGSQNGNRNFLEQFSEISLMDAQKSRETEDPYRILARSSLEHKVKSGGTLPFPDGLPEEMLNKKAGVFVSLHKNGRLRGCIGTIAPTTANIAREIIQNAVSAGLSDTRFEPVDETELPYLTYKVDVLSAPSAISGPEELDVKRYGVIVTNGHRRGLLLPNLDGIDTVEEQIAIAKRKAGISEREPVQLERFEVIRHE
jgi:AmmeMemoRadiSam system protein A